ncbi:DPP IV N-terminal domain-containing protein [Flavobacterium columnare]|uniref:Xaa-Pro dipeptidyl-peptidase n=1 Tax=Flavobacterium columnare (strain ATCC 49512 / CIP 103533 / TG 44/87) TaxID=1041826 RepID=G8X6U1_FLACA|nr:S9 family peptidase [Flavobacterium columnare]AEW85676.1 Xaa-Pro dipeptidyl-peptidase [Flavobacterium columnare ATCC 49512]ANO47389.1 Xaa-Pro dipeptidyl-peptidase [Flavobacterium columnare]APT21958.1 S9 family peptidase [Flavobacterium columnare]MBF6655944.1 S9 family peptidase [Flavobacterium columnare]MBF6657594.1 S9 family peptidase [Flavobacterium columnare]
MKNKITSVLVLFLVSFSAIAQKQVSLEEIWSGAFRAQGMTALEAMKNTNQYTVLDFDKTSKSSQINLYDFATLTKVATLIDSKNFSQLEGIDQYTFSKDEKKILIANNSEQIFRHSFVADYFIYDTTTKSLTQLTDYKVQEPSFSPDGSKITYVYQNNLYFYDIALKKHTQITTDGKKNNIINGVTDWVYEEEFSFVKAYDWNLDSNKIGFIRFDETDVPQFSMDLYNEGLYPLQSVFKYPKAGEKNALVSLHIYDIKTGITKKINLDNYNDFYIARIKWTNDPNTLSAQILNRHQNNLDLLFVDGNSGTTKVVLNEKDKAYVDVTDNLTFLKDNSFIWTSEKEGFNHIYHYDKTGKLKKQITKGPWEVTHYYGFDEKNSMIYYQSVENGSINRDVYAIKIDGSNKTRLTSQTGTNTATFSPNFQYFINSYSSAKNAPKYTLNDSKTGKEIKVIASNEKLEEKLTNYNLPSKEFFELITEKGHKLNTWIIKPTNFDTSKKYPVFMFQYSGPGSQQVANKWNTNDDYWFKMLAQQGYIIVCVDGRGTGFKGAEFKKCTYKELGKYEVIDQIDAAKVIGNYSYVDKTRIGIFGWSFGGFMASNCIFQGADVFKTAIAVAPVTSWRYYDSIYTERYMQTPQENAGGYDNNSPITHVNKLKGNFLLIHGTADDNVHVQNTMKMIEALVQANKQFDWAIYPDKNHGIYGGKTRLQLYTKMTHFIKEKL